MDMPKTQNTFDPKDFKISLGKHRNKNIISAVSAVCNQRNLNLKIWNSNQKRKLLKQVLNFRILHNVS